MGAITKDGHRVASRSGVATGGASGACDLNLPGALYLGREGRGVGVSSGRQGAPPEEGDTLEIVEEPLPEILDPERKGEEE